MKRLPDPCARFKRTARSKVPFWTRRLLNSSSNCAALIADTVSLRALQGGLRRAKPAPHRGTATGFHFRSTESPLSHTAYSLRNGRPWPPCHLNAFRAPSRCVAFAGVLPSCSFIITHFVGFVNSKFTIFENIFYFVQFLPTVSQL